MKTIVGSLIILFAVHTAHAAVIVSQPIDSTKTGEFSNLGPSNQQVADDFILTQTTILNSISWYGRYDHASVTAPEPTVFSIRFFEDNGGTPQTSPFQTLTISPSPVRSELYYTPEGTQPIIPWFSYTAALPALSLAADTYWLSILEDDPGTDLTGDTQWLWADSNTAGLRSNRVGDSVAWVTATDIDHAFSLNGTEVPVPAALWLFGSGLLGLVGMVRRKKA